MEVPIEFQVDEANMTKCIYNTDHAWFLYLRASGTTGCVNFWRKDKRILHLKSGSPFYFRIRPGQGEYFIAGESEFLGMKPQTAGEAWEEFGFRTGADSKDHFLGAIARVLSIQNIEDSTPIMSIVLDRCIWYPDESFVKIDTSIFPPSILGAKFYQDTELDFIPKGQFPNFNADNNIVLSFPEGGINLATHQKRERNSKLVDLVKKQRNWICDICNMLSYDRYQVQFIEAHHKVPLSVQGVSLSVAEDLVLLCPNCHTAVHRLMAMEPKHTYAETRLILLSNLSVGEA